MYVYQHIYMKYKAQKKKILNRKTDKQLEPNHYQGQLDNK